MAKKKTEIDTIVNNQGLVSCNAKKLDAFQSNNHTDYLKTYLVEGVSLHRERCSKQVESLYSAN